jgi:hypothetical protein
MSSEMITVKLLETTSVFCQIGGCGEPARYLFSATKPKVSHNAYCDVHTDQLAKRHGLLQTPPSSKAGANRWSQATA